MNSNPSVSMLVDGKESNTLDFGIVPAGASKIVSISIENKGNQDLYVVSCECDSKEVSFENIPEKLAKGTTTKISVKYAPTLFVKSGLKANFRIRTQYILD